MASEREQKGYVSNPFLDPIGFWQNYLINWIEASRGFYEHLHDFMFFNARLVSDKINFVPKKGLIFIIVTH
jgi:hypothetical protein